MLKQVPDDFVVDEICRQPGMGSGRYSYFVLKKRGIGTREAISRMARSLNANHSIFGYAGMKDRHAVTSQLISVKGITVEKVLCAAAGRGFSLEFAGCGDAPVTLGCLEGNRFMIVVRNISADDAQFVSSRLARFAESPSFPNYFGGQRFSVANHLVGRKLVRKEFRDAAVLASGINRSIAARLHEGIDAVSCFRAPDRRSVLIYLHAYQALIFNASVSSYLQAIGECRRCRIGPLDVSFPEFTAEDTDFPVVGFSTEMHDFRKEVMAAVAAVLKSESISPLDFVIRQLPLLSCEGVTRNLMCRAESFMFALGDDELNAGMKKCVLSFSLPKGSYATVLVDFLFSQNHT